MAKKTSGYYKSTGGPGPIVIPTGGTGTGGSIPTSLDPVDGPIPKPGLPGVSVGDPLRPPPGSVGTGTPDYTGNIGQYGSYGPSMTNMFGAPGSSATKIIYRDVMVNQNAQPDRVANVQPGTEAAQMQDLVGSQADQARQEVLRRMGVNAAGNASFDPRRPQSGGIFGIPFSKTTDSKNTF